MGEASSKSLSHVCGWMWGIKKNRIWNLLFILVALPAFGQQPDTLYSKIFEKKTKQPQQLYAFVDSLYKTQIHKSDPQTIGYFWLWKAMAYHTSFDKTDSAYIFSLKAEAAFKPIQSKSGLFQTYLLLAQLHIKDRNFKRAQTQISKAFSYTQTTYDTARCFSLNTLSLMHSGDTVKTLPMATKTLKLYQRAATQDIDFSLHLSNAFRNLAWSYQALEDDSLTALALPFWHQSNKTGKLSADFEAPSYLYNLQNMAYCFRSLGALDSAFHYIQIAEKVLTAGQFPNIHWQKMNFYRQYAWIEYERGNYQHGMDLLSISRAETDRYFNAKMESTANELALKYNQKLKQQEIDYLATQNKIKNHGLVIQGVFLLLLLGITLFAWLQYRKTKIQNAALQTQRNELESVSKNLELSLKEIHHRIKNNLQIINSLLNVQKNKLTSDEAQAALADSQGRIRAIALVHEQLYSFTAFDTLSIQNYTEKVVKSITQSSPLPRGIQLEMNLEDTQIALDKCVSLGIILNELIMNAIKYAFHDQTEGALRITGSLKKGTYQIIISDTGPGVPKGFDYKQSEGVGFKIIQALVLKLKAEFDLEGKTGTTATLNVPLN